MKHKNNGILISFEGTDCSGKETQSKALEKRLNENGIPSIRFSFPDYESPTGKIVGGPILGKKYITESWFPEGSSKMNPYLWSLYLAADRFYHKDKIKQYLDDGYVVITDRWVESNMGIQTAKISDSEERKKFIDWEEKLEYELLELPKPNMTIFLYMPFIYGKKLRDKRKEPLDDNEKDEGFQKKVVETYLELAKLKKFIKINCVKDKEIRDSLDIQDEIYIEVNNYLKQKMTNLE